MPTFDDNAPMRLHKFLAHCGVASRRKAEEIILAGRVTVNGEPVIELGTKVEPDDVVTLDGNRVGLAQHATYLFFKPRNVMTTLDDPQGRPTVRQYMPPSAPVVKPVGRLDFQTDGLLLLTNDGDLAMRLTHARYGIEKEYKATVSGYPDERTLRRLRAGLVIEGKRTAPAVFDVIKYSEKTGTTDLCVILHEGRKRQIRVMMEMVGHPVVNLRRVRIAHLTTKGMVSGELRLLGMKDVERLRQAVGLPPRP
ncbi:MAG: rRNA pseudouridine synthase [Armatimonadetes bacterium]|nr:rRNA pseudouridine synthase [Armatimonadota bacterium]